MPFESKVYNYKLPEASIKQTPYTNPNQSKLLIADTRKIIEFNVWIARHEGCHKSNYNWENNIR